MLRLLAYGVLAWQLSCSAAAQAPAVAGVTYGQPKVTPGEYNGDLSLKPLLAEAAIARAKIYRPRLPGPPPTKFITAAPALPSAPSIPSAPLASMPGPIQNFAGLSSSDTCTGGQCGAGWPPDPNGDVGPNHYIETVNDAVAIYSKTGTLLASFTEDQLWIGQGTPCDGNSQGDPVVVYDWLEDRFVLSWFAFASVSGPFYQCIAASKTSDPVAGGWWLYPVRMDPGTPGSPPAGDLNDYVKAGLWHDCLYLAANEFTPLNAYDGVAFASLSRADLYSGAPLTFSLGWLPPSSNAFTMIPSNNLGKGANAAQPGTPNYFVSESQSEFAFEVRAFTAGANCGAGGTLGAPTNVSQAQYSFANLGNEVPQPNTTRRLDSSDDRLMQKVQYRKRGGNESLWVTHNVDPCIDVSCTSHGPTAMQWAQIDVTGGTIATTPLQQQIYTPDSTLYRWMGSLAVDSQGNMALGYSTSNGAVPNFPSIAYSGRLAADWLNTLPQGEVQLVAGAGSQLNTCGGRTCHRWGDYTAMSVDPADDCTFWYVNQYYSSQSNGTSGNWQTRIGSFRFPSCLTGIVSSTTTLTTSANPAVVGQTPTLTATVTGVAPSGTITFYEGESPLFLSAIGTSGPDTAVAHYTPILGPGTHSLVASYSGDANNTPSTSAPLLQVVIDSSSISVNVALSSGGAIASASSVYSLSFPVSAIIDGARAGLNFGAGGVWRDGTPSIWPDWVEIDFSGAKTIDRIIVYSMQDDQLNLVDPSDTLIFTLRGVTAFDVQTWNGSAWVTQGSVTGNNLVKRTMSFAATTTPKIRVNINAVANGSYSLLTEVEAWTPGTIPPPPPGTALVSSANPVRVGKPVTFMATVTGSDPTGTVRFTANATPITGCNAVALSGSGNTRMASCATSFASKGSYAIIADYSGDGSNAPSTSNTLTESVRRR